MGLHNAMTSTPIIMHGPRWDRQDVDEAPRRHRVVFSSLLH
jgi:hypothetical protein